MSYETRLRRLEDKRRQPSPSSHFVPVLFAPGHLDEPAERDWLQGLICPCGRMGCPELDVGVMLPEKEEKR